MPQSQSGPRAASKKIQTKRTDAADRARDSEVIDFDRYIPTVVASLMSTLRASARTFFDERYGVTRLDWLIISFLATKGPSSAYNIWTAGNMDKAAVSRALKALERRELISIKAEADSRRGRTIVSLTRAGRQLHNETFREIVKRHDRLMGNLTPRQIDTFVKTVRYLRSRVALMDTESDDARCNYRITRLPAPPDKPGKASK